MIHRLLLCLVFTIGMSIPSFGQVNIGGNGELNGTIYGDYYWFANHFEEDVEGSNGFWFRRIYFTYNHQLSDSFSGRVRLEMSSEGDFISNAKIDPVIKDAWLKYTTGDHAIIAGISSTPTWGVVEDVWGYRSVEKSPLDLYDFGSSRDFGVAIKGNLDPEGRLNYHFMFANGNSNRNELNQGKKLMFSLGYELTENLVIEGYADWDDRQGDTDRYTMQGFAGYRSEGFNLGALYAYQLRKSPISANDRELEIVSLFANGRLSESVSGYARVDHAFQPFTGGPGNDYLPISDQAESTFITTGVDIILEEQIHLLPNIETVLYGESDIGERPDPTVIPRLTLAYSF